MGGLLLEVSPTPPRQGRACLGVFYRNFRLFQDAAPRIVCAVASPRAQLGRGDIGLHFWPALGDMGDVKTHTVAHAATGANSALKEGTKPGHIHFCVSLIVPFQEKRDGASLCRALVRFPACACMPSCVLAVGQSRTGLSRLPVILPKSTSSTAPRPST